MSQPLLDGGCHRTVFGTMPDGREVEVVTLANGDGLTARILTHGAALQSLLVSGPTGEVTDVVLGHGVLDDYLNDQSYLGATIGRVANRIAGGRFKLDTRTFRVPLNNGSNSLHGGAEGFDRVLWQIVRLDRTCVTLRYVSPDGDQGFPGTLQVDATYSVHSDNGLIIELTATTDEPTVVNLTHHSYWNLAGEGSTRGALDHLLAIPATHYLPVDGNLIPIGERRSVAGTPFDFRSLRPIADRIRDASDIQIMHGRGYDHSWVLGDADAEEDRLAARLEDPVSGRTLELFTNQPAVQLYTANHFDGRRAGKAGHSYRQGDGIALEPQGFPNSPNTPGFPSIRLNPGQTYRNRMLFRFSQRAADNTTMAKCRSKPGEHE